METYQRIPLGSIDPSSSNPRKYFDKDKLAELAESIKAKGVLEPILVRPGKAGLVLTPDTPLEEIAKYAGTVNAVQCARNLNTAHNIRTLGELSQHTGASSADGPVWAIARTTGSGISDKQAAALTLAIRETAGDARYELVAGERRLRGAKLAGLAEIPAIVRELADRDVLEIQVVENEQREDVGPLEKAEGYGRLIDEFNVPVEEVAARIGKSKATVLNLVKLRSLPPKAKEAVQAGELSPTVAGLIARIPGEKARLEATSHALHKDYDGERPSYRSMKQTIQHHWMIELKQAPFSQADKDLIPGTPSCKACPKRAGNNRDLYPDTRADVCTDPECYKRKVTAHRGRMYQQASRQGLQVLDGDETETATRMGLGQYGRSKWVELDEEWSIDGNRKTVAEWLKGSLDEHRAFACGEDGKSRYLVPRAEAVEILEAKGRVGQEKRKARDERKAAAAGPSEYTIKRKACEIAVSEVIEMVRANVDSIAGLDANGGPDTDAAYQALWIMARCQACEELYYGTGDSPVIYQFIPNLAEDADSFEPGETQKLITDWAESAGPTELLTYLLASAAERILEGYGDQKDLVEPLLANFTDAGSEKALHAAALKQLKAERAAQAKPSANGKHEANGHAANGKPKKRQPAGV